MKSDRVRLLENLVQDALKTGSERDALKKAKARQDRSHAKLDKWIAAAIAELSPSKRIVSQATEQKTAEVGPFASTSKSGPAQMRKRLS
jgi:hypothetical protein